MINKLDSIDFMKAKYITNIFNTLTNLQSHYSPKIVAEVNDELVKVVKILGGKVPWHNHPNSDELFLILEGSLFMEIESSSPFKMNKGDIYTVKMGVNHRVYSEEECTIILIERKDTKHTGDIVSEITKSIDQQL